MASYSEFRTVGSVDVLKEFVQWDNITSRVFTHGMPYKCILSHLYGLVRAGNQTIVLINNM